VSSSVHRVYFVPGMFGFGQLAGYDYFKHVRLGLEQRFAAHDIVAQFEDVPAPPTSSIRYRSRILAATIAKSNELLNGALASWLCVGIGVYAIVNNAFAIPLWQLIFSVVTTPVVYLMGAYLWLRRNRPLLFAPNISLERMRER